MNMRAEKRSPSSLSFNDHGFKSESNGIETITPSGVLTQANYSIQSIRDHPRLTKEMLMNMQNDNISMMMTRTKQIEVINEEPSNNKNQSITRNGSRCESDISKSSSNHHQDIFDGESHSFSMNSKQIVTRPLFEATNQQANSGIAGIDSDITKNLTVREKRSSVSSMMSCLPLSNFIELNNTMKDQHINNNEPQINQATSFDMENGSQSVRNDDGPNNTNTNAASYPWAMQSIPMYTYPFLVPLGYSSVYPILTFPAPSPLSHPMQSPDPSHTSSPRISISHQQIQYPISKTANNIPNANNNAMLILPSSSSPTTDTSQKGVKRSLSSASSSDGSVLTVTSPQRYNNEDKTIITHQSQNYESLQKQPKKPKRNTPKPYELTDNDELMIQEARKFKGVNYHPLSKKFRSRIKILKKTTHLGYYDTVEEAAMGFDLAAIQLHGERASTNYVPSNYEPLKDRLARLPGSPRTKVVESARILLKDDVKRIKDGNKRS